MRTLSLHRFIAAAGVTVALGVVAPPYAQAQVVAKPTADYWGGRSKAASAACAQIEWTVVPVPRNSSGTAIGPINGVAYYSDMSGISKILGTITDEGKVTATLTSVSGAGPAGAVTGLSGPKGTHVELVGAGCANTSFDLPRFQEQNAAGGGG